MAHRRCASAASQRGCTTSYVTPAWSECSAVRPRLRAHSSGPRQGKDPCPGVKAAGFEAPGRGDGTRQILKTEASEQRAPTPEAEKRYRREYQRQVGKSAVSKGQEDLPLHQVDGKGFGRPSQRSESAGRLMQAAGQRSSFEDRAEMIYESNKREPVGKGFSRGMKPPSRAAEDPEFRFGQPTGAATNCMVQQGKDTIAPAEQAEDPETHARYVRTHQAFDPGEQVDRRYAWPTGIKDPKHAFGRADGARLQNGAAMREALASDGCSESEAKAQAEGGALKTRIVSRVAEEAQWASHRPLGGPPAGRPASKPPVPEGFAFGARPAGQARGEPSAGDLIRGYYKPEEQQPDRDLGRCVRDGRRNVTADTRAYGKPSRPEQRGAFQPPPRRQCDRLGADADDVGVGQAIAPGRFADEGLGADDFSMPRSRDEVRSLLKGAGYDVDPQHFARLWDVAVRCSGPGGGRLQTTSLDAVIKAYAADTAAGIGGSRP
eukprot:TRINITY_DN19174_c0_g1_i3.p1 TRINITY_DN19174_c0_g1~~TRINITY_DN19174_c0_g1_i3.p1  ORF type:complete len:490 (+),score=75.01 TRINITY_DN19174_c0_g1_i3:201-1670(+)